MPLFPHAQTVPDAGSLLQQQQQQAPRRQPAAELPTFPDAQRTAPASAQQAQVLVKSFRVEGELKALPAARIAEVLKAWEGRPLSLQQLQSAVDAVTQLYRDNGWFLARAVLPPQDVTEGVIRVQIVEGLADRREPVRWLHGKELRLALPVAEQFLAQAAQPGQALQRKMLERSLLLLNDLPGIRARASLEPGAEAGSSKLVMELSEGPLVTGAVALDNHGSRYSGSTRMNTTVSLSNPSGQGDQLQLLSSVGLGDGLLENVRLNYQLPVGGDGLRLGLQLNHLRYGLGEELSTLKAQGLARHAVVSARYPVIRNQHSTLSVSAAAESGTLRNDANGATVNDKRLRSAELGVQLIRLDDAGQTQGSLTASQGRLNLGANPAHQAQDHATGGSQTEGSFSKLSLQAVRWQALPGDFTLQAQTQMQWANRNLDSSEKMSLGGAQGVRAYPSGEAAGDRAWRVSIELSRPLAGVLPAGNAAQWSLFVDAGEVQQFAKPGGIALQAPNRYRLSGIGAGLSASIRGVDARIQWAKPLGSNPGRSAQGKDSDGLARSRRLWLELSASF